MIEEQYVSRDTARMLKEAGFDCNCRKWYEQKEDKITEWEADASCNWNLNKNDFSCPTQALAARWLREAHNIHVVITEEAYVNGINYLWQVLIYNPTSPDCWDDKSTGMYGDNGEYKTYEEALEAGLREAIKLLKK